MADSLENCKITGYAVSIKNLPDKIENQADWLKAQFDARTDDEVKQQHNALCELLAALGVEESVTSEDIRGLRVGTQGSLEWKDAQDAWHSLGTGEGVTSFAGRAGAVEPQAGDYTAADVGAYTKAETDEKIDEELGGIEGLVPTGAVVPFAGAAAPEGWLLCNGQSVSRTAYAALFAAIGTTYGSGNGSSTFNVPDLRQRVAVGADPDTAPGTLAGAATHVLGDVHLPPWTGSLTNSDEMTGSKEGAPTRAAQGTEYLMAAMVYKTGVYQQPISNVQPSVYLNYIIKT